MVVIERSHQSPPIADIAPHHGGAVADWSREISGLPETTPEIEAKQVLFGVMTNMLREVADIRRRTEEAERLSQQRNLQIGTKHLGLVERTARDRNRDSRTSSR